MERAATWFLPVSIAALLWNLLGLAAFVADATLTPDDIAGMSVAQQSLYASRPWWSVAATAVAVVGGTSGSLGLVLRRRWALHFLLASLLGVIVQDAWLFGFSGAAAAAGPSAAVLQGVVLLIAVALVGLARRAVSQGWLHQRGATARPGS